MILKSLFKKACPIFPPKLHLSLQAQKPENLPDPAGQRCLRLYLRSIGSVWHHWGLDRNICISSHDAKLHHVLIERRAFLFVNEWDVISTCIKDISFWLPHHKFFIFLTLVLKKQQKHETSLQLIVLPGSWLALRVQTIPSLYKNTQDNKSTLTVWHSLIVHKYHYTSLTFSYFFAFNLFCY